MGLDEKYISFIDQSSKSAFGDIAGKTMLELGNQIIREGKIREITGKAYYSNRGVSHISIDLNGQDGALKVDLSKPIKNKEWFNHFDIITNAGTTEHVEPRIAQYVVFMNIHNFMKVGGIAIHLVPDINELELKGKWKNHSKNYYSSNFFQMLAENNSYETISIEIINGLICVGLRKTKDIPFMNDQNLFLKYIIRKKGGVVYRGINDSKINQLLFLFISKIKNIFN